MTDLTNIRRMIQVEETQFRAPLSENTMQKIGQGINFINTVQHSEKQFFLNGKYGNSALNPPLYGVDGMTFFQYDAEIIDVWMFIHTNGTSGTTELDVKRSTDNGATWNTIFSTTPKILSAAGSWVFMHIGSSFPNIVAPVLTSANVNAGDALRLDLIQAQVGDNVETCGIVIHYRPR
jgi:hypothetical protein